MPSPTYRLLLMERQIISKKWAEGFFLNLVADEIKGLLLGCGHFKGQAGRVPGWTLSAVLNWAVESPVTSSYCSLCIHCVRESFPPSVAVSAICWKTQN